jgi:hypothetical protein
MCGNRNEPCAVDRLEYARSGRGAVADTDAGDLVKAALGGDRSGWDELVRRYSGLVWSVNTRIPPR